MLVNYSNYFNYSDQIRLCWVTYQEQSFIRISSFTKRFSIILLLFLFLLKIISIYPFILLFKAVELSNIKIIRIENSLHNSNATYFKQTVIKLTGVKPQKVFKLKMKLEYAYLKKDKFKVKF